MTLVLLTSTRWATVDPEGKNYAGLINAWRYLDYIVEPLYKVSSFNKENLV